MTRPLKAGDLVYRVIEFDPPNDTPHTWKVACVAVVKASDRQVKLKTHFLGLGRLLFKPDALGRAFFETPLQAIQFFVAERRLEIESLERRKKEAQRALAWGQVTISHCHRASCHRVSCHRVSCHRASCHRASAR